MRIIAIHLYSFIGEPVKVAGADDLSFVSFFQRGTLREFINFNSRTVIT